MATRRAPRRFQSGGPRRRRVWSRAPIAASVTALQTDPFVQDVMTNFRLAGGDTLGCTVGAVHLELAGVQTTAPGAGQFPGSVVGLRVGNQNEDPIDIDPGDFNVSSRGAWQDWLWWDFFSLTSGSITAEQVYRRRIRSMRKFEELGQTLWLAIRPNAIAAPFAGNIQGEISVLLILP